ncbi:CHRD domain-containing protein [Flavobacteriaceae bacterium GSB9]|nr:CHRD domain-containing protein [Flavobacteriaceae bacterium GSB9]
MKKLLRQTKYYLWALALSFMLIGCSNEMLQEQQKDDSLNLSLTTNQSSQKAMKMVYTTSLNGENEVPGVDTNAVGECIVSVNKDGSSINFKLIVANLTDVIGAHFHWAPVGENGPVVIALYSGSPNGRMNGILAHGNKTKDDLTGPLADMEISDFIDALKNGSIYVNVHTSENPGGEIRGQL